MRKSLVATVCLVFLVAGAAEAATKLSLGTRREMLRQFREAGLTKEEYVHAYRLGIYDPIDFALHKAEDYKNRKWNATLAQVILLAGGNLLSTLAFTSEDADTARLMILGSVGAVLGSMVCQVVAVVADAGLDKWHLKATQLEHRKGADTEERIDMETEDWSLRLEPDRQSVRVAVGYHF